MKKKILITLLIIMIFSMFTFVSCDKTEYYKLAYDDYDLSEYVTLLDYSTLSYDAPNPEVTDEEIEARINENLEASKVDVETFEGTVKDGDKINISYNGVLADGTTLDGMNSESFTMTMGVTQMIDGFSESIIGRSVGEEYSVNLTFPDPYENNTDLSGKAVTFTIKVLSILVPNVPVLNDEWVATHNDNMKTVDEYKAYIKETIFNEKCDEEAASIKQEIYEKICSESTVSEVIPEIVEIEKDLCDRWFHGLCNQYGVTWEEFLPAYLQVEDEESYRSQLEEYGKTVVESDMILYCACQKEGIKVTQEEIDSLCSSLLSSGQVTEEQFEEAYGVIVAECLHYMSYDYQLFAGYLLDKIYESIMG